MRVVGDGPSRLRAEATDFRRHGWMAFSRDDDGQGSLRGLRLGAGEGEVRVGLVSCLLLRKRACCGAGGCGCRAEAARLKAAVPDRMRRLAAAGMENVMVTVHTAADTASVLDSPRTGAADTAPSSAEGRNSGLKSRSIPARP